MRAPRRARDLHFPKTASAVFFFAAALGFSN
jgi:hypothetical protein